MPLPPVPCAAMPHQLYIWREYNYDSQTIALSFFVKSSPGKCRLSNHFKFRSTSRGCSLNRSPTLRTEDKWLSPCKAKDANQVNLRQPGACNFFVAIFSSLLFSFRCLLYLYISNPSIHVSTKLWG